MNLSPKKNSAPSASPRENPPPLDDITGAIVDAALKIHLELGPGLLESVYEAVLARALEKRGFQRPIRRALIEADLVDTMVSLPGQILAYAVKPQTPKPDPFLTSF